MEIKLTQGQLAQAHAARTRRFRVIHVAINLLIVASMFTGMRACKNQEQISELEKRIIILEGQR